MRDQCRSWRERHGDGEVVAAEGDYMMIKDLQLKHRKKLAMQERAEVDWGLVVGFLPSWDLLC